MSAKRKISKIVNDPVEQLLVSLSLILYLLYLNNGYTVLLVCTLVLDALFIARILQMAFGKDKQLGAAAVRILSFLDYGLFFLSIYLLFNLKERSDNTVGHIFVILACIILVIMTVISGIATFKKQSE